MATTDPVKISDVTIKTEDDKSGRQSLSARVLSLCEECPQGLSDKMLQLAMSDVSITDRAATINSLLQSGKIELLESKEKGLLYRAKKRVGAGGDSDAVASSFLEKGAGGVRGRVIRGDAEEKLVYGIVEEAGNKGTWIRDIRIKSNLVQTQLNKVLKSLKSKKLVKEVKCVNSTRKIVYMLYDLEPDRSVTGGAWYSDHQDFESEFVEILNQQCHRFLSERRDRSKSQSHAGPVATRNASTASSKEVLKYISELGISKVQLKVEDIEAILDTLIYDGKVEKMGAGVSGCRNDDESARYYRATEPLLPTTGLMRVPCGGCQVFNNCCSSLDDVAGSAVNPRKCVYMKEWMS